MELRHLRYFVAAAEEKHFGRAARRLHIVQPGLSKQIQNLEAELGVPLFERMSRGIRLTKMGETLLDDARRILEDIEKAGERVRRVGKGQLGRLRLGCAPSASWYAVVLDSLSGFRRAHRDIAFDFTLMKSLAMVEALRSGSIDAGFGHGLDADFSGLDRRVIYVKHAFLVVPRNHALARRPSVRLTDLVDEGFVWPMRESRSMYYERLMAACIHAGLTPRIIQESTDEATTLSLVSAGLGISFVTSDSILGRPKGVVLKKVVNFSVPLSLELMWRKDDNSPILRRFIDVVLARSRH